MKNALFIIFLAACTLTSCNTFKNAALLSNNDLIHFIELNEAYQDSIKLKGNPSSTLNSKGLNQSTSNDFTFGFNCPECEALRAKVQSNCMPKGGPCIVLTRETLRLLVIGPRINPYPNAKFSLINNATGSIISSTDKSVKLRNVASRYTLNLPNTGGGSFGLQVNLDGKLLAPLQINRLN